MALTPEQVLNKQFQMTQFRKGYDERDVDDFLDEIVVELRALIAQRDDYKQQLDDCRAGRGMPPADQSGAGPADDRSGDAGVGDDDADTAHEQAAARLAQLRGEIEQAQAQLDEVTSRISAARDQADAPAAASDDAGLGAGAGAPVVAAAGGLGAAGLIELAQRVHDEHVAKGQARHDELVDAGQARHDELVGTAQTRHDELLSSAQTRHDELLTEARERSTGMIAEAQSAKDALLAGLVDQQHTLEAKLDALRGYERTYRSELRSYFEGKLAELDQTGADLPEQPAAAQDGGSPEA